jgi:acetyltransferase
LVHWFVPSSGSGTKCATGDNHNPTRSHTIEEQKAMASPHAKSICRNEHALDVFFAPKSVAIFGATDQPGCVGRTLMSNLIRNPFGGWVLPINPCQRSVHGIEAYPNLSAIPTPVELAIVGTPAATVGAILDECRDAGVKAAIILSGGFGESRPALVELERKIRTGLLRDSMRVVGPNSIGIACPPTGFNATVGPQRIPLGKIGFLSQSNALLNALLHQEGAASVGCSAFVSLGFLMDVTWAEWLNYLAEDPQTECIGIYMEHLHDARSFFAAAQDAALKKPIILIKGGKGVHEASGHHHRSSKRDHVFDEACRCSGVVRVDRFAELLRVADHLTSRPKTKGRQLAIVTNARGPALLASDALHSGGGSLAALAPETIHELREVLAPHSDCQNPIDIGDDATACRVARAAAIALRDSNVDALLVLLAPHPGVDPVKAAAELCEVARTIDKPVLACWMWEASNAASLEVLRDAGIPAFHSPEAAVRTFEHLWQHTESLSSLSNFRELLAEATEEEEVDLGSAEAVSAAWREGRTVLTEIEASNMMSAYGIPVMERSVVSSEAEAIQAAEACGYPVLVEWENTSENSAQDSEMIRLEGADEDALRKAFQTVKLVAWVHARTVKLGPITVRRLLPPSVVELTVSITTDPELGAVMQLGQGDQRLTARQSGTALAPLTLRTTRQLIDQVRARDFDEEVDLKALERILLQLSRLVVERDWVKEITVASLLVWNRAAIVRDVHVALHGPVTEKEHLPEPTAEVVGAAT